jgi:hypothetical protein
MNERIRELADRCRTEYRDGHGGFTEQFDEEKFAELIVQECAEFIKEWERYQVDMANQCNGNFPTGGDSELKEHFGVE